MAEIVPFAGLRYDLSRVGDAARVLAPPYDVIGEAERSDLEARDAHNVVRVELPRGEGDSRYGAAANLLRAWIAEGVLRREPTPAMYLYEQQFTWAGKAYTRQGLIAALRLEPFDKRVVLPHEHTLTGPKEDRRKLLVTTRTQISQVFGLYRDADGAALAELEAVSAAAPALDATTNDGTRHRLWVITEAARLNKLAGIMSDKQILIADGHHRYETALRYSQETDAAHPNASQRAEHRYFMTFLANGDSPDLVVFPTHRHVHSLPDFSFDRMVQGARAAFDVEELPAGIGAEDILDAVRKAGQRGPTVAAAGGSLAGGANRVAVLTLRPGADASHPVLSQKPAVLRATDVTVLHAAVLEHLLGITPEAQAAKTNLWYPQDARAALADVRSGRGQVLFLMNATPVAQVRAAAEAGEVMPQKSTFFYPKVATGLAIHTLDPSREVAAS
jgi:uncharacterized protein (DUF1015 family)